MTRYECNPRGHTIEPAPLNAGEEFTCPECGARYVSAWFTRPTYRPELVWWRDNR